MERGQALVCGGRKKHRAGGGCMHLLVDSLRLRSKVPVDPSSLPPLIEFSFLQIDRRCRAASYWLARSANEHV
jgi:hypothetical protein